MVQKEIKEVKHEKPIVFLPGPIGLQLEPIRDHPKYACRVVRFADGGPNNPGQARQSGLVSPGDFVVSAVANGIVANNSYDEIMRVLKYGSVMRTITVRSAWESSYLDSFSPKAEPLQQLTKDMAIPAADSGPSKREILGPASTPSTEQKVAISSQTTIGSTVVPAEMKAASPPEKSRKALPAFDQHRVKYFSLEKLQPIKKKNEITEEQATTTKDVHTSAQSTANVSKANNSEAITSPQNTTEPMPSKKASLPEDWVNNGIPLQRGS